MAQAVPTAFLGVFVVVTTIGVIFILFNFLNDLALT
tara:strand:+ start:7933 stop:8040 length:108 start_codon:yes stop_codon:yes gene_type:complete